MSKGRKRSLLLAAILIIAVFAVILFFGIRSSVLSHMDEKITARLEALDNTMEIAQQNKAEDIANYKELLERMIRLAVFYLENSADGQVTNKKLQTLTDVFNAENLYQVDSEGNVLLAAYEDGVKDFSDAFFSPLLSVSPKNPTSTQVIMNPNLNDGEEEYLCYQSAYYDGNIIVLKKDWSALDQYLKESSSWESVISRDTIGGGAHIFAVSEDGKLSYSSHTHQSDSSGDSDVNVSAGNIDELEVDSFALTPGEEAELLETLNGCLLDGWHGMLTISGKPYYARCRKSHVDGTYLIAAALFHSLSMSCLLRVIIIFAAVFILLLITMRYALWVISREKANGVWKTRDSKFFRNLFYLFLLDIVVTAAVCIYSETLCFYAAQARSNEVELEEIKSPLAQIDKTQENGKKIYTAYVRTLTDLAAALIEENPDILNTKDLRALKDLMGVEHILVYDDKGMVIASDQNYKGMRLSFNDEKQSNEFRWLLYGEPFIAQDDEDGIYLKKPYVYAGSAIMNGDYEYNGMVQIAYPSKLLVRLVNTISIRQLLASYEGDNNAFAFVVEKETGRVRSAIDSLDLNPAEEAGLTERELHDDFDGFFYLKGKPTFGFCEEVELFFIFVAIDTTGVSLGCVMRAVPPMILAILAELCVLFVILLAARSEAPGGQEEEEEAAAPTGTENEKKFFSEMDWRHFLANIFFVISACSFVMMQFQKQLFPKGSLIYYVIRPNWTKGLDIFSFTYAILGVLCIYFLAYLLTRLLELLGKLLPLLEQTFIRMLLSLVRFLFVVLCCFYVADRLGAPTKTLLASAGILSIIVGLAAQGFLKDILAGLSIIFERTFKVGDVIKINGTRGKVLEIGIRNTRMIDLKDNNIKIINNSMITSITNYSMIPVYCNLDFKLTFEGNLHDLEKEVEKDLPSICSREPYVIMLKYMGAEQTSRTQAVMKFQASCEAEHFNRVYRNIQRELLQTLHKKGITAEASGH